MSVSTVAPPVAWENVSTLDEFEILEAPHLARGLSAPASGGCGIALLDLDGDGSLDLLMVDPLGGQRAYLNGAPRLLHLLKLEPLRTLDGDLLEGRDAREVER